MITSSVDKLNQSSDIIENSQLSKEVKKRKLFYHDNDLHLVRISNESIPPLAVFLMRCFFFNE